MEHERNRADESAGEVSAAANGQHTHPEAELLAQYLEDRLPVADRQALEQHLNVCPTCRDDLIEAQRAAASFRRRRVAVVALPVAAAVVGLLLVPWTLARDSAPAITLRDGPALQQVVPLRPADQAIVAADTIRFAWSAPQHSASFRITVTDSAGNPILDTLVSASSFTVPTARFSARPRTYLWFVDALFSDGRVATTTVRQFRIP